MFEDITGFALQPCFEAISDAGGAGYDYGPGYDSPQAAAKAFAEKYYGFTESQNREIGALIVAYCKNGKIYYTYHMVTKGYDRMVALSHGYYEIDNVYNGTLLVGDIHTHCDKSTFSEEDSKAYTGILSTQPSHLSYLANRSHNLFQYSPFGAAIVIDIFTPIGSVIRYGMGGNANIVSKYASVQ